MDNINTCVLQSSTRQKKGKMEGKKREKAQLFLGFLRRSDLIHRFVFFPISFSSP